MFVMFMATGFFVHGFLLKADYTQLPNLFRTEQDQMTFFAFMPVADERFMCGKGGLWE